MNTRDDRCPGVYRTHQAADGRLARVRLSGGRIDPAQLEALAEAAEQFGDGHLELTVRGNLQVRGIDDDAVAEFAQRLVDAGLAGDADHDRVRNISVSPRSGRLGGVDLWPLADRLDDELRRHDWTGELSGRFWFGFDDGHGDVLTRGPDVGVVAAADGSGRFELVVAAEPVGRLVTADEAVPAMLAVTREFLSVRDGQWNVAGLDPAGLTAVRAVTTSHGTPGSAEGVGSPTAPLVGWFDQDDGRVMLGAVTEFARLTSRQAQFLAAIGAPVVVTPSREILIADLSDGVADTVVRVLAPMGFVFDANSPWTRLSACTGAPGCEKSHADVRGDLRAALAAGLDPTDREHWTGCDRGCGAPSGEHVRVVAEPGDDGPNYRRDVLGTLNTP